MGDWYSQTIGDRLITIIVAGVVNLSARFHPSLATSYLIFLLAVDGNDWTVTVTGITMFLLEIQFQVMKKSRKV